jgi:hypothetical protein
MNAIFQTFKYIRLIHYKIKISYEHEFYKVWLLKFESSLFGHNDDMYLLDMVMPKASPPQKLMIAFMQCLMPSDVLILN